MDIEAILGMLMAPLILFVLVVAPIWIIYDFVFNLIHLLQWKW